MSEPIPGKVGRPIEETVSGKYFIALGILIEEYAKTEFLLRRTLEEKSGIAPELFHILIGPVSTSQVIEKLKELLKLPGFIRIPDDQKADMRAAFEHLGKITTMRDRMIHAGGNPLDSGQILIRPKPPARLEPEDLSEHLFDPEMLYLMVSDLQIIQTKLLVHFQMIPDSVVAAWSEGAKRTWSYKPRPPKTPSLKPRTKPQ